MRHILFIVFLFNSLSLIGQLILPAFPFSVDSIDSGSLLKTWDIKFRPHSVAFTEDTYTHLDSLVDFFAKHHNLCAEIRYQDDLKLVRNADLETRKLGHDRGEAIREYFLRMGLEVHRFKSYSFRDFESIIPDSVLYTCSSLSELERLRLFECRVEFMVYQDTDPFGTCRMIERKEVFDRIFGGRNRLRVVLFNSKEPCEITYSRYAHELVSRTQAGAVNWRIPFPPVLSQEPEDLVELEILPYDEYDILGRLVNGQLFLFSSRSGAIRLVRFKQMLKRSPHRNEIKKFMKQLSQKENELTKEDQFGLVRLAWQKEID